MICCHCVVLYTPATVPDREGSRRINGGIALGIINGNGRGSSSGGVRGCESAAWRFIMVCRKTLNTLKALPGVFGLHLSH
jgi:hypothetical protein